jgi:hypothetical protein
MALVDMGVQGWERPRLQRSGRVTEPTALFLLLSAVATAALVVAGTASALWFLSVLLRLGLRLRFAPA